MSATKNSRDQLNKHRLIVKDHINQIGTKSDKLCTIFYTHLFRIQPNLTAIFNGGAPMLNRKFNSMLSTFKNLKDLEKMASAMESMAERHVPYHAEVAHFPIFKEAFILALHDLLHDDFTPSLKASWEHVFDEVTQIMVKVLEQHPETGTHEKKVTGEELHLLENIGGESVVQAVHTRFYDYIYDDEFIGGFFHHRAKSLLIRKQSEFMIAAFGGPNNYRGQPPAFLHMHMFITKEMSDVRDIYLRRSIREEGISEDICKLWLKVDHTFHAAIEKKNIDECVMRVPGQYPMAVKKPEAYKPPVEY